MSSLCSVCNSYPCPGCTSRYIDDVVRLKAELAASTCECTELRKDVSALKRIYGNDVRRLVDAVRLYGDHLGDCDAGVCGAPGDARCTCGYDEAAANGSPPLRPLPHDTNEPKGER